jgi:hypothetical protein
MKKEVFEYLSKLTSGFLHTALLLLDFLGIVLLFWPGFPGAQIVGISIFILSFGFVNFRIYHHQNMELKRQYSDKKTDSAQKNLILRSLIHEIEANKIAYMDFSCSVWDNYRNDIHWLASDIQDALISYFHEIDLLIKLINSGTENGWASWMPSAVYSSGPPPEVKLWLYRKASLQQTVKDASENLIELIHKEINVLVE